MTTYTRKIHDTTFSTPNDREILIERVVDAPPELVFDALVDPEKIRKWWGPRRYETKVDSIDVRPGGNWRFIHRDTDGNEYGFHGEFLEIHKPDRLSYTFEYEGDPGKVSVDTATLKRVDGKTKITARSVFDSTDERDQMLKSGMEEGAAESYDRLAELLENVDVQRGDEYTGAFGPWLSDRSGEVRGEQRSSTKER